jgi:hypothetical protein
VNSQKVNEINVGEFTEEAQEVNFGGQLLWMKKFGTDNSYPAIP